MVKALENRKRVFWEALLLTVVVFFLGVLIGISFESGKVEQIRQYYSSSEISVMDLFASNNIADLDVVSCVELSQSNFEFADRIYEEAVLLEKYESSGKITDGMILEHQKYDLLRTLLWINEMKTVEKCGRSFNTVVYLYEYQPDDLAQKATQSVWSRILVDLKYEYGSDVLLIPIAIDSDLISLNSAVKDFNITNYPALIVNDEFVVSDLSSVEKVSDYFN